MVLQPSTSTQNLDHTHQPRSTITTGLLLTAVAWLVSRLVVAASWTPALDPLRFFSADPWARWDSFNYVSIALHGSTFGRCGTPGFPENPTILYVHLQWCGSAAWLPGYSWLIEALHQIGMSPPGAALLISWSAVATAIFLVWLGWLRELTTVRALLVLVLFGIFPGAVYDFALFPLSFALTCIVGALLAATRERFITAALLTIAAGLCYPSAWFAAGGLAIGLVVFALPLGPAVTLRRALWGVVGLGSLLLLGLYDQMSVGHFNAYFRLQDQPYTLRPHYFPGGGFLALVIKRNTPVQQLFGRFNGAILAVQAILAVSLSAAATFVTAWAWRRKKLTQSQLYPALAGLAVIVMLILVSNNAAWDRSVALAAPCAVCLRRAPLAFLLTAVTIVGITTALISRSFFVGA